MSSITQRDFNQGNGKQSTASQSFDDKSQSWGKAKDFASQASLLLVPLGLSGLIALSVANGKLFLGELLLSSFIIIALMFFKASAAPRK
jgi:hypothetical protein